MKKLLAGFILLTTIVAFGLTAYANDVSRNTYYYEELQIEVRFDENNSLSEEQKQKISEILAYDLTPPETRAWCWLTGHDKVIHTVTVITHKARTLAPRCLDSTYNVTTCNNCDYYYEELVGQQYIFCCPTE